MVQKNWVGVSLPVSFIFFFILFSILLFNPFAHFNPPGLGKRFCPLCPDLFPFLSSPHLSLSLVLMCTKPTVAGVGNHLNKHYTLLKLF